MMECMYEVPVVLIEEASITLKLASLAERSPWMRRLLRDTSVVSFIRGCFESRALCNPLVKAMVRSPSVMVSCFVSSWDCMEEMSAVTLVAKLAELSKAAANLFNVLSVSGAPSTKSLPCIKTALISITLKLASFAERSPWMRRLLRDTSVVSFIRGCFESRALCNPLVKAMVRSPSVMVSCFVSSWDCMEEMSAVTLVAKLAELSKAAANLFNVLSVSGAPSTKSLPCIKTALISITLKLASFAERSPWMRRLLRDTSVVSSMVLPPVKRVPFW